MGMDERHVEMDDLVCTFCGGSPTVAYYSETNGYDPETEDVPDAHTIVAACDKHIDCLDEYIDRRDPELRKQLNDWHEEND